MKYTRFNTETRYIVCYWLQRLFWSTVQPFYMYLHLLKFQFDWRDYRCRGVAVRAVTSQIQFGDVFQLQNSLVLLRFWLSEEHDKIRRATPPHFIMINCFLSRVNLFQLCLSMTSLWAGIVFLVFIKRVSRQDTNQTRSLRLSRQHLRIMP